MQYNDSFEHVSEKVLRFLEKLQTINVLAFSSTPISAPIEVVGSKDFVSVEQVVFELSYVCPLRCRHCFIEAGVGPSMPSDGLYKTINALLPYGLRAVQLTGGEPFTYKHLEEVVTVLSRQQIPIQITTSGYILNKQARSVIASISGLHSSIQVSVDGLPDYHNALRGVADSFERAIDFIDFAINNNVRVFSATTLIDQSESDIDSLCKIMKAHGVSLFRIGTVIDQGRAVSLPHSRTWDVAATRNLIKRLAGKYDCGTFKIGWIEDPANNAGQINCGAGTKMLVIDPYFNVRACPMTSRPFGNILDDPIEHIMLRGNKIYLGLHSPRASICGSCPEIPNCSSCIASGIINGTKVSRCRWKCSEYSPKENDND